MRGEFFVEVALFVNDIFVIEFRMHCFLMFLKGIILNPEMRGNKRQGVFIDQEWEIS